MRTWWVPAGIVVSASVANCWMPSTLYTNLAFPPVT